MELEVLVVAGAEADLAGAVDSPQQSWRTTTPTLTDVTAMATIATVRGFVFASVVADNRFKFEY